MQEVVLAVGKIVAGVPLLGHLLRLFVRAYNLYYAGGPVRGGPRHICGSARFAAFPCPCYD